MKTFSVTLTIMILSFSFAWAKKVPQTKKKTPPKAQGTTLKSQIVASNIMLDETIYVSGQFAYDYLDKPNLGESCALYLIMKTTGRGGPNEVRTFAYLLKPDEEVKKTWSVYKVVDENKRKLKIAVFPDMRFFEGEGRENYLVTVCR